MTWFIWVAYSAVVGSSLLNQDQNYTERKAKVHLLLRQRPRNLPFFNEKYNAAVPRPRACLAAVLFWKVVKKLAKLQCVKLKTFISEINKSFPRTTTRIFVHGKTAWFRCDSEIKTFVLKEDKFQDGFFIVILKPFIIDPKEASGGPNRGDSGLKVCIFHDF